ncbi:MAG: YdcF family protein [Fibrobacteraceae bacterium]|nr:YdcF family protein [Fibrobacteraceae bacterium]
MTKILMKESPRAIQKKKKIKIGIVGGTLLLCTTLLYVLIAHSGHWLVSDDDFNHVNWVVVLDGQTADLERSDVAADILSQGKADSVMILGRRAFRDKSNADFYAEDFMKLGNFDSNAVFIVRHNDPSTIAEAYTIIPWLKAHKADTVLLLTAAPATRRAKKLFSSLSGEKPVYLTMDIHHHQYNPDGWIFNRESRKNWLHEWAALFNSYLDLMGTRVIDENDSSFYRPIRSVKEDAESEPIIDLQKLLPQVKEPVKDDVKEEVKEDTTTQSF